MGEAMGEEGKKRETVFDHNPTKKELDLIFGSEKYGFSTMTKEKYFRVYPPELDDIFLFELFRLRGDLKRAKEYYRRCPMPDMDKMWHVVHCDMNDELEEELRDMFSGQ